MEIAEYEKMYKFEEKYWWWVGKREIVKDILDRLNLNSTNILDTGCGTGFNLNYLKDYGNVVGLDFSKDALNFCKMRGNKNLVQANAEQVPFKGDMFDLIVTLDLLEHLDDNKTLKEFYMALKSTGYLIVTVPAFEFLWSEHDEALHHKRRYNKAQLRDILELNGFIIENISYWNFFLFLPIVAMRLIKRRMKSEEIETDVKELPPIINRFLASILRIENHIISHSVNLPFGVSIVCVCKKSEGNDVK